MMHVRGYHEYRGGGGGGGVQYRGGTILCSLSTVGDIMIHVGNIMSAMGVQYCGGTQITKDLFPHGTEHPHGTHDITPYAS